MTGAQPPRVRAAAALSEHPLTTHAVGECIGHLLDAGGGHPPDALALFVTGAHVGALEDVLRAVGRLVSPRTTVGASAGSLLAGRREVEEHAALSMFALWAETHDAQGHPRPVRIDVSPRYEGPEISGLAPLRGATGTLLLIADPFTCPVERVLADLEDIAPDLTVLGGSIASARQPGGNRLVLDQALHTDGAVGVLLPPSIPVRAVVSQGSRPIGTPLTVTAAHRNRIEQLAGRPAYGLLVELLESLGPEDRQLATRGLRIGRVIDEYRHEFTRGDFLVHGVLGADRDAGAVVIADEVEVGSTVQFHLRDAATAHEDLTELMAGRAAAGALVFTCHGRGSALFGVPDHDAETISEALSDAPVAGMFCAGEIGPVGHRNFLHSFTTSVALIG